MMSSEEDTQCFGLYDKLLINRNSSEKNVIGAGINSLFISNSNSNSSSITSNSSRFIINKKCHRQRVPGGEQRNSSYSSIPTFSFRPSSFLSSASTGAAGFYGTLLNQSQSSQFVGSLFGTNGFGSVKMLNEILDRQMKQAQDATGGLPSSLIDNAILTAAMESATSVDLISASIKSSFNSSNVINNNCMKHSGIQIERGRGGASAPVDTNEKQNEDCGSLNKSLSVSTNPQLDAVANQQQTQHENNLAHHMLRNILQGKKDLIALDQELRSVINKHANSENLKQNTTGGSVDPVYEDNNSFISKSKNKSATNNNNNNNNNYNDNKNNNNNNTSNNNNNNSSNHNNNGNNNNNNQNRNNKNSYSNNRIRTKNNHNNSSSNNNKNDNNTNNNNNNANNNCNNTNINNNKANKNKNNNSHDSTNRNFICENESGENAGVSNESKSISHSCSNRAISHLIGGVDQLVQTLESCSDVQIKSEPNTSISPTSILNEISNSNPESNNKSKSCVRVIKNSLRQRKCIESEEEQVAVSEETDDLTFCEMQQPQLVLQSDCHSLIDDIVTKKEADALLEEELMVLSSRSDIESMGSPSNCDINEIMIDCVKEDNVEERTKEGELMGKKSGRLLKPVILDMKRARVENIISSMQSSPSSCHQMNLQVNGCKKRKLYQPQQHAMDRYAAAAAGLNFGLNMQSLILEEEEEEDIESPQIQQKRVQKNALKSQLRTMQEQLAEMQQKYVQLCSRIEQESECQEVDDTASDSIDNFGNNSAISPPLSLTNSTHTTPLLRPLSVSPLLYSRKPKKHAPVRPSIGNTPPMLAQIMSKMITAKIHSPTAEHSQKNSLLQNKQHVPEVQNAHATHPTISNAAAMYLGQHFLLEHEVRIAKETAEQHERHQQFQQQIKEHQQKQHEIQIRFEQEQKEALLRQKETQQQNLRQQNQLRVAQQHRIQTDVQLLESQSATSLGNHLLPSPSPQRPQQPQEVHPNTTAQSTIKSEISERFNMLRSHSSSTVKMSGSDLEGLADILKSEITTSLSALVDTIVTRFVHQRRLFNKQSQSVAAAADQLNKDLMMASHILDRKSPRTKATDQLSSSSVPIVSAALVNTSVSNLISSQSGIGMQDHHVTGMNCTLSQSNKSCSSNNLQPSHLKSSPSAAIFQAPKTPQNMSSAASVSLYNSIGIGGSGSMPLTNSLNPFCMPEPREHNVEQNEALSLVVTPKKKRHKVTDTRITPRTVSRILAQDGNVGSNITHNLTPDSNFLQNPSCQQNTFNIQTQSVNNSNISVAPTSTTASKNSSPLPNSYHPPAPPMMSVTLPTSVAIPNPSLHESQVFSPYSPFFNPHHGPHGSSHIAPAAAQMHHMKMSSSPPGLGGILESRDSPSLSHPPTMMHPALLSTAHHGNSPDYNVHLRAAMDTQDRNSDCNSTDMQFDGIQPTISFLKQQIIKSDSLTPLHSSTLTPMHLRKAKLMFFWVRYPSSAVLKMYFPDIKFNKNNTAQLVKWFSNFREFYYIQMEKYARQAVTEGIKHGEDLHVGGESELYRVLNLHYNRNNHIEVPSNFRFVVEQTLREFFRAIQGGKDTEQSWKKSIYKIISRMDDPVPEYFKSPNFLEQLE
ncbi:homeobox protein prospero isoform X2 [Eupeodes corollae]|uniref:homeobox protein prospero isoform X2 n=1 Tax=Eupeodes corollae TaxID=290404 RepID=UPI0024938C81|nr:homeobox protein prospero isoform X2 [Eupeodes corollae]